MNPEITAQRKILYGTKLEHIVNLVMTPEREIFESLTKHAIATYKGWWHTSYLSQETAVVKCWKGRQATDAIYYSPHLEQFIFLGYCGSCVEGIELGGLFSPTTVMKGIHSLRMTMPFGHVWNGVLHQVDTLHEQDNRDFIERMRSYQVDCIDMESYAVMKVAQKKAKLCSGLYVVSDNVLTHPYWMNEDGDNLLMRDACGLLAAMALQRIGESDVK